MKDEISEIIEDEEKSEKLNKFIEEKVEEKVEKRFKQKEKQKEKDERERVSRRGFMKKIGVGALGLGALSISPVSAYDIKSSHGLEVWSEGNQHLEVQNGEVDLFNNNLTRVGQINGQDADNLSNSDEYIQDLVNTLVNGGDKLSWSYDDTNDTLTINTSALDTEEVEDAVSTLISGGQGVSVSYDDANSTLTISVPDGDITEAMLSFDTATQSELDSHTGSSNPHSGSASQNVGVEQPVYSSTADVPSGITKGETVYIDGDGLYVEDGS